MHCHTVEPCLVETVVSGPGLGWCHQISIFWLAYIIYLKSWVEVFLGYVHLKLVCSDNKRKWLHLAKMCVRDGEREFEI